MTSDRFKNHGEVKILVVEDNILDFELMEAALCSQVRCNLKLTMTKADFEMELEKNRPDVIISDSNVVSFDGFTALQIASDKCPEVPFCFCSGSSSDSRLKEVPRGDVGWVTKDSGFAGLVAFVKKALDTREEK